MFPVSTNMAGMAMGVPDVCLTPSVPAPIPVPYPNIAMHSMANPGTLAMKFIIQGGMAQNLGSMIMRTSGDEAGVAGGIMSGLNMGPSRALMGSMKLFVGGMPAVRLTSMTMQNLTNVPAGTVMAPDQVKVMCV
jgi:Domain of unknown function (DUF4150)